MSSMTREVALHRSRPTAKRSSWTQVLVASLFIAIPAVIVVLSGYSASRGVHPTDRELTASYFSHESDFQALLQMLDSDRRNLPVSAEQVDLAYLAAAGVDTARMGSYEKLLTRIGVGNFRYFPRSWNLVLPVSGAGEESAAVKTSYRYLSREEPPPLF